MEAGDGVRRLLEEIRDLQREHLTEYRKVTERSLELQQRAVARQEQFGTVYRKAALVGVVIMAGLLGLLGYILARWSHQLF